MKEYKDVKFAKEIKPEDIKPVQVYIEHNCDIDKAMPELAKVGWANKKKAVGKLVYYQIYKKSDEPKATKEKDPTIKDLILSLEGILGEDLTGLIGAKKGALLILYNRIKELTDN